MIAWLALMLLGQPNGVLLDQVVAVVDKDVLTQSELQAEARIALAMREGERAAALELSDALLAELLEYVINQTLVAREARRLGGYASSESDVDTRVRQFVGKFASTETYKVFLRKFALTEVLVRQILERDLNNEIFVARRIRTRLGPSSDKGSVSDIEDHRVRYQRAVNQWLSELRQAVEIRRLGASGELELVR